MSVGSTGECGLLISGHESGFRSRVAGDLLPMSDAVEEPNSRIEARKRGSWGERLE